MESIRVARSDRRLSPSRGETAKRAACEGDLKKFALPFVYVVVGPSYLLPLRPSRLPIDRIAGPMRNFRTRLDAEGEHEKKRDGLSPKIESGKWGNAPGLYFLRGLEEGKI